LLTIHSDQLYLSKSEAGHDKKGQAPFPVKPKMIKGAIPIM
jgi:hypothetical protein